jgi:hypothetical protein
MLAAGLGVGVIAGALFTPPTPVQAAQLIAVRQPVAAAPAPVASASGQDTTPSAAAGAPAAPAPAPQTTTETATATSTTTDTTTATTTSTTTTTSTSSSSTTTSSSSTAPGPVTTTVRLPAIKHVWFVVLADQSFASLYGPASPAHFLTGTLVPEGTLLSSYYAVAHGGLADGVALISGQGPTPQLQSGCATYAPVAPGTVNQSTGLADGKGCVFGPKVTTLPDQLAANSLTWRAYIAGQGAPGDTQASCRHPVSGAADPTAASELPSDGYLTRRNPFVYFASLTKQPGCSRNDVGLSQLGPDLAGTAIPAFSWIAPDLCTAGANGGCPAGATATGPAAADAFLSTWIPQIEATSAYKKDGMIVILADQAPATGDNADSSACCGKLDYANTSNPGGSAQPGPGGGRVGALVLSPFAARGKTDTTPADHFTLLRTLEDIFNLPYLGYAAERHPFGKTVFPSEAK